MLGRSTSLSHPGRRRRRNEDSFVCEPPLFAIADGMGGAQAGQVASGLAAGALRERANGLGGADDLVALVQEANRRVYERAEDDTAVSGMGTTMTAALVDGEADRVVIAQVGDSRCYLIRDGTLEQQTQDHSLVAELVRSGKLTPEEAEVHPQRSVITRALGSDSDVDVDVYTIEAKPGDIFLLCSDGLSGMVSDPVIFEIIEKHRDDLDEAAHELIAAANRGGGDDNITVVVFEITHAGAAAPEESTAKMSPVGDEAPEGEDDEDTLSGLDAPPAVGTMVVRVDELDQALARDREEKAPPEEPEPEQQAKSHRGRRVLALLALIAFLAVLAVILFWALSNGGA